MTWLPRTPHEALIQTDSILADIIPQWTAVRAHITSLIPGHSGRPAGNGDPPGGSSFSATSVVERQILTGTPPELADLALYDHTTDRIVAWAEFLTPNEWPQPLDPRPVPRLAWARWATRQLARHKTPVRSNPVAQLHAATVALADLQDRWTPHDSPERRNTELAADDTETWCRSHLRVGALEPRSDRYPRLGLCRWCGAFQAEQGFLPTLDLLDHHVAGKRITQQMVDKANPRKSTRPKKRRKK